MMVAFAAVPVIGEIVKGVGGIFDELFTSDEERQKAKAALEKIQQLPTLKQLEIDLAEAKHASVFVAGARPALKWVVAGGVGYDVILRPLLAWVTDLLHAAGLIATQVPHPPQLDIEYLIALLAGGGGLYGFRSWEKINGKASRSL